VKLTVIGCSPAWPNPAGAQSGYLLQGKDGRRLLLDCGPGVLPRLRTGVDWPRVDAIAITHFHLDHWGDLVPWVWGSMYGPGAGGERPELIAPPGGAARLSDLAVRLGGFDDMFDRAFRVREYAEGTPVEVAGFELRATRVPHYGMEAFAFRVDDGTHTLAYSGDSGPTDLLADVARDAVLFVCEATLAEAAEPEPPRGHLSLSEAEAAFAASGAHRLLITHRPRERETHAPLELAYDGLEIEV
jgi:ribonuclease BN (tRNA processing enzyme)